VGLKENIIIGKLIPAGTGMDRYRAFETVAPDYEPMQFWTSEEDTDRDDLAAWLATQGGAEGTAAGNGDQSPEPPEPPEPAVVVDFPQEGSA
jgi:DNA-directed RNA polymerase subunit beta'